MAASSRERFRLITRPTSSRLAAFAHDVAAGLTASPKRLSCCYFYDQEGSALFEEICTLPEYYLTRCEEKILWRVSDSIAAAGPVTLVELGSGNAAKTRLLIAALLRRQERLRYVPIDISASALSDSALALGGDYPRLDIHGIAGTYEEGLAELPRIPGPRLVCWLGSNVGNFSRPEAAAFLGQVRAQLGRGDRLQVMHRR